MSTLLGVGLIWTAESASSTSVESATAWPYLAIAVLVTLSLVGTALKVTRNQNS